MQVLCPDNIAPCTPTHPISMAKYPNEAWMAANCPYETDDMVSALVLLCKLGVIDTNCR